MLPNTTDFTSHEDREAISELRAEVRHALCRALAEAVPNAREILVGVDGCTVKIGIGTVRLARAAPRIWVSSLASLRYPTPRLLDAVAREAGLLA